MTDQLRALTGWGRTAPTTAHVTAPGPAEEDLDGLVERQLKEAGTRGLIARGLGRSYGDAAQNAGGDVLLMTGRDRILDIDLPGARVTVEAGVSLDRLMRTLVPFGLWPAVSPGTRQVTVGGAIASDVHGKGHHRDGTFSRHVHRMRVVTPGLGPMTLDPDTTPAQFWATAGGMGLTGVVTEATLDLLRIETNAIKVDAWRTADLDQTMSLMAERDSQYRYSVAWIDCVAKGASMGRSIVEFGEHATVDDLPAKKRAGALRFDPKDSLPGPPWAPSGLLNGLTIAAFNELWYRKSPKAAEGHIVPASFFFHPLDLVRGWNRMYGRRGFIQYQFVLPDGQEAVLRRAIEQMAEAGMASFFAVLKRFGPANPGPLSFPSPGWTLALDLPVKPGGMAELFDRLDEQIAAAGGRIYLSKDSRLRPDLLETMYPELPRWRQVRARMDPDGVMTSDLARRLPALGARP